MQVIADVLAAIEATADLNAFWTVDAERAMADAREAEAAWRRRGARTPPLLGVPVAVKDLFDTARLRTTYGSSFFRDHVPAADAATVAALRRAGAIVVGKTATHEFAYGLTTVNPHFGPTRNPHDRSRVVGGSSGGSAAAVAAGLVPIALGSDTSCSSRLPPSWTGCVGFRPTHDTISLAGAMPLAPSLDTVGPIAATVADVRLLAEVLWRGSPGPLLAPRPSPLPGRPTTRRRPVRVGVVEGWAVELAPAVRQAMSTAVDALTADGCKVDTAVIDGYTWAHEMFGPVMLPEAAHVHRRLGFWPDRAAGYGADVAARLRLADSITLADYLDANAARRALRSTMARAFDEIDIVLTPSTAMTAPPIEGCDEPMHLGRPVPIRDLVLPFHVVEALCGCPAVTLPVGQDDDGLPTSVMLSAARGRDHHLLAVAERLESALGAVHRSTQRNTETR